MSFDNILLRVALFYFCMSQSDLSSHFPSTAEPDISFKNMNKKIFRSLGETKKLM